jgi:hypothetical protein
MAPFGMIHPTVQRGKWIILKSLVRAVGIEPTLLSEPDFESSKKYTNILIYIPYILSNCASVLINVLILFGGMAPNLTLRGP